MIKLSRIYFLSAITITIILFPWIPMPAGLPLLRPEWFIMLAGLALLPISRRATQSSVAVWTGFVFVAYLLSMVYGAVVMGINANLRDMTEFLKPVLYFFFFVFVASGTYTIDEYRRLLKVALISLCLAAFITLIQFFNPDLIQPILYLYRDNAEDLRNYILIRSWGTMGNPNEMGFLMALAFGLSLYTLRYRILLPVMGYISLLLFFTGVFATGSRTGMVCLAVILLAFVVLELKKNLKSLSVAAMIFAAIVWGFNAYIAESEILARAVLRVTSLGNIQEDMGGWVPRVEGALSTFEQIQRSWLFGYGPAKEDFMGLSNVDNEYILIWFRSGLIGLIATLGLVFVLASRQKSLTMSADPLLLSMRNLSIVMLGAAALFAYTAGVFGAFRLFILLIILWVMPAFVLVQDGAKGSMVPVQRVQLSLRPKAQRTAPIFAAKE